jgi:hypothetical protein
MTDPKQLGVSTVCSINQDGNLALRPDKNKLDHTMWRVICEHIEKEFPVADGTRFMKEYLQPKRELVLDCMPTHEAFAKLKELAERTTTEVTFKLADPPQPEAPQSEGDG